MIEKGWGIEERPKTIFLLLLLRMGKIGKSKGIIKQLFSSLVSIRAINMNRDLKENNKQKHLFKAKDYCSNCQQNKSCGILDEEKKYCCVCYRKILEELEWESLLISSAQQVLNDYRQRKIICKCLRSEKPRVKYLNSDGSGWTECERCERLIDGAGHHRVIKNRNDPRFWGIEVKEKVLCSNCLGKLVEQMPRRKKYLFREYGKRKYV